MSLDEPFRVIAIISAFNEGDIIGSVIGHLIDNGIEVYLLDNHSTDDTVDQASRWIERGLLNIEKFPSCSSSQGESTGRYFDWTAILRRKEELATELPATWFIHHDADEIRESPWPGLTLKEAILWVDRLGYTAIDFQVVNFVPTDDDFKQGDDPRTYFKYYQDAAQFDKNQLKCWKAGNEPVSLALLGGHEVSFSGRRVCPVQFLLRHYPIRSQRHGVRKVFQERKTRFLKSERSQHWHLQYDNIKDEHHAFTKDPALLRRFDLDRARFNLLLPEKLLQDLADRLLKTEGELDRIRSQSQELDRNVRNLERGLDDYKKYTAELDRGREVLEAQAVRLVSENGQLRENVARLEREREAFQAQAIRLVAENGQLREYAARLEKGHDELQAQAVRLVTENDLLRANCARLEQEREAMQIRAASLENLRLNSEKRSVSLEQQLTTMQNSKSWRWTAPFRRVFRLLGR